MTLRVPQLTQFKGLERMAANANLFSFQVLEKQTTDGTKREFKVGHFLLWGNEMVFFCVRSIEEGLAAKVCMAVRKRIT